MAQAQTKLPKVKSRERLHQLVDQLPQKNLSAAQRLLEELKTDNDPVLRAISSAPLDDEPVTKEEEAAIFPGNSRTAQAIISSGFFPSNS